MSIELAEQAESLANDIENTGCCSHRKETVSLLRSMSGLLMTGSTPRPMHTAPKDASMVRLLVQFDEGSFEDSSEPCWTIGTNHFDNTAEDEWLFAGWNWTHDCFTQGTGTPIGWLPLV